MTRQEMKHFTSSCSNVVKGYCTAFNNPNKGRFREVGSNSGVYGWNWTLFYDPETDTAYVDGYRNF